MLTFCRCTVCLNLLHLGSAPSGPPGPKQSCDPCRKLPQAKSDQSCDCARIEDLGLSYTVIFSKTDQTFSIRQRWLVRNVFQKFSAEDQLRRSLFCRILRCLGWFTKGEVPSTLLVRRPEVASTLRNARGSSHKTEHSACWSCLGCTSKCKAQVCGTFISRKRPEPRPP